MLDAFKTGKRVINIDETWFNETNFIYKMWTSPNAPATVCETSVAPRVAMIAALDSDGQIYFSLTHANTDSSIMMLFLA